MTFGAVGTGSDPDSRESVRLAAIGIDVKGQLLDLTYTNREPPPWTLGDVPGLPPQRAINSRVKFTERGQARSLGHIVYWSSDPDRSMKFYTDRLGFRMTGHVRNKVGVFARATW